MNPGTFQGAGTGVPVQTPLPKNFQQTVEYVRSSKTWVAPANGWVRFVITGGGGGGAAVASDNTAGNQYRAASGGAAAGFGIKTIYVSKGNSYVITIGAGGGVGSANSGINGAANGSTGGTSSVVGPSIYLVANGGGGGQTYASNTSTPGTASASTGGTCNGADISGIGGSGAARTTNSAYGTQPTGGGGVGVFGGTGVSSVAGSGAGAGTLYTYSSNYFYSSPGSIYSANGSINSAISAVSSAGIQHIPGVSLSGILGTNNAVQQPPNASGPGCGGSGNNTVINIGDAYYGMAGGAFAGGASILVNDYNAIGGQGGYGGGGGGAGVACNTNSFGNQNASGGSGGQGLVIVEWLGQ